jgi:hypothetical protein
MKSIPTDLPPTRSVIQSVEWIPLSFFMFFGSQNKSVLTFSTGADTQKHFS